MRGQVSPLTAPNASSNIIASTIAIWFRFGGPNLMVCSGATAGLDAIGLASLLLRAGRADRVVVVGVEPDDEVAAGLHRRRTAAASRRPLRAGAACVVLEPVRNAPSAPLRLGAVRSVASPATVDGGSPPDVVLAAEIGEMYGATGVVQVAAAAYLLAAEAGAPDGPVRLVCGDESDGWRTVNVMLDRARRVGPGGRA